MTSQDTEALKALAQHLNELASTDERIGDLEYQIAGEYALETLPALERMLASQGAVFADNGDEIEARLKYDAENACPACGGSVHKDDVAPPLAEPDVEAAAKEIWEKMRSLPITYDATSDIEAIIRKHSGQREGWVLVPREPTEEMKQAANKAPGPFTPAYFWSVMLKAAPDKGRL